MMFNFFSGRLIHAVGKRLHGRNLAFLFLHACCISGLLAGCSVLQPKLPPVNLQEPGWTLHEGQAVWHRPAQDLEIAGDVLVATRADGSALAQFTKTPFPLLTGQLAPGKWKIEIPPENKAYSGRGNPPKRILLLQLARVLAGRSPPHDWTWTNSEAGWRLENHRSGESLEGYFSR